MRLRILSSLVVSTLNFGARLRLATAFGRAIGRLIWPKVAAEVVDQGVAALWIHLGAPLDHLVHFFGPDGFAEALLHDNARLVTAQARGCSRFLPRPGW